MSHTYTHLAIHIVFSTKDRTPSISVEIRPELFAYMGGIVRNFGGKPIIINGLADHVHLLISLPPTMALADALRVLKANSSKWVHESWPERSTFGWQTGYGAFSVSHSAVDDVTQYIQNQETHHRKYSFQEEFLALLKKHNIPYDEPYIWG
jgi:putative transposase